MDPIAFLEELHSRDEVWPGAIPLNTTGTVRAKLAPNRPYLTTHYTGGGLWVDPGDTPKELQSLQVYAQNAGKPWEYNYVIDSEGHDWEYAGDYQAAHSAGENNVAIGILIWVGLADASKLTGFEKVTDATVLAYRRLRAWLVTTDRLAEDHTSLKHKQMPGAATICPGPEVDARWSQMQEPWRAPEPERPPIETQPTEEEEMPTARLWRDARYKNGWLIGAGPALHLSAEVWADYEAAGIPVLVQKPAHEQMLDAALYQSGLNRSALVPA